MEQVNYLLYQDLCVELLKDYKSSPDKFLAFVTSGKEAFQAFNIVCKSVHLLAIANEGFHAEFKHDGEEFVCNGSDDKMGDILLRKLFKHARSAIFELYDVDLVSPSWFCTYLDKFENLEELELSFIEPCNPTIKWIRYIMDRVGSVKRLTASIDVFRLISQIVTDYKLDKMTTRLGESETLQTAFNLARITPTALSAVAFTYDQDLESFFAGFDQVNANFHQVQKLELTFYSMTPFEVSNFVLEAINKLEMAFPNLKELVFECGSHYDRVEIDSAERIFTEVIPSGFTEMENVLSNYGGRLTIKFKFLVEYQAHLGSEVFCQNVRNFMKSFKGFAFSESEQKLAVENHVSISPNVGFTKTAVVYQTEEVAEEEGEVVDEEDVMEEP